MVTYNKFNQFVEDLGLKVHNLNTDTLKVYLSNVAPNAESHVIKSGLAEFSGGTGYVSGGTDISGTWSAAAETATLAGTDVTWTATAADWNPFREVVLYNDTSTSPADPLIAWWEYTSTLTLGNGETFTVDFSATIFTLA